jgi:type IV secretory pathway VirJ component
MFERAPIATARVSRAFARLGRSGGRDARGPILALALALASPALAADGGRYGEVEVIAPKQAPRGLVLLFSDRGGLQAADRARLHTLADEGAIAVGVDSEAYLQNLERAKPGCLTLFEDAEDLSRQLQRQFPAPFYRVPIAAGSGLGGAVAGAIVAQSPLQTVGAALAVDPAPGPLPTRELCPRPLEADDREGPGTIDAPVLKNPWRVALSPAAAPAVRARFSELKTPKLDVVALPAAPDAAGFAALIEPWLAPPAANAVAALPLVELPAAPRTRKMAIFLSGDGGWRDVDKRVSEKLQSLGVSVVGWDSLKYFWARKTPDETAADLAAVLSAYTQKWGCDEVALIGFSFGADVMPFLFDRLDPSWRRRIALVSLMSPGAAADWRIRVAGWFGAGPSDEATPLEPAVAKMPGAAMQCFYGKADAGNSCGLFAARGAEAIAKPGDHHMDGDYDLIGREIFEGFEKRTAGR